jgi:endonuclease/exonuclease/phosphatase family metal-dependent hydrolase
MPSLCTFNANNFFLRYRFDSTFPGDAGRKSWVETTKAGRFGYVPERHFGVAGGESYVIWDGKRRELAARALREGDDALPDVLCLQEVENLDALRRFNDEYLGGYYRNSLLIDGWDPRNIDVGVMSVYPIAEIRTHIDDRDRAGARILSRDCLEVTLELPGGEHVTLFVNHLKSKFADEIGKSREEVVRARLDGHEKRKAQAKYVSDLVRARFADAHDKALYAVVGDLNDTDESPWLKPLLGTRMLHDVVADTRPREDRWTYYWRAKGRVQQIDYILASRALASRVKRTHIARSGVPYRELSTTGQVLPEQVTLSHFDDDGVTPRPRVVTPDTTVPFRFDRYPAILEDVGNNVSDHCPVKVWF